MVIAFGAKPSPQQKTIANPSRIQLNIVSLLGVLGWMEKKTARVFEHPNIEILLLRFDLILDHVTSATSRQLEICVRLAEMRPLKIDCTIR
jgi:hypothetical protein